MYEQARAPEQPCIENVGNTWGKKRFPQARSLERGPLSRLPSCHPSRMRMSAATMIRPLHLSYRAHGNVLPFPTPFSPPSLIMPF